MSIQEIKAYRQVTLGFMARGMVYISLEGDTSPSVELYDREKEVGIDLIDLLRPFNGKRVSMLVKEIEDEQGT